MKKKVLSIMLSMAMTATILAGCGSAAGNAQSGANTGDTVIADEATATAGAVSLEGLPAAIGEGIVKATPEMYKDVDLSKHKTVNITLIGDTPTAWSDVLAKTNEYLEPFNTDVEVSFLSWSDYQQMYSLTLTGGQVDLIFTAPWCFMYTEAAKGSFYVLDNAFVAKNMPLTNKYQATESWDETTISGQMIAVPSNQASPMGKIVAIRQDLADKYGISSLNNWNDYMNFATTIAEKETPESGIYALAAAGDNNELWDVYRQQEDTFLALDSDYFDLIYNYKKGELPDASDIKLVYETDLFKEYAKDMKELADAGAWSRSALTNTVTDDDAFGNLLGEFEIYGCLRDNDLLQLGFCLLFDPQISASSFQSIRKIPRLVRSEEHDRSLVFRAFDPSELRNGHGKIVQYFEKSVFDGFISLIDLVKKQDFPPVPVYGAEYRSFDQEFLPVEVDVFRHSLQYAVDIRFVAVCLLQHRLDGFQCQKLFLIVVIV